MEKIEKETKRKAKKKFKLSAILPYVVGAILGVSMMELMDYFMPQVFEKGTSIWGILEGFAGIFIMLIIFSILHIIIHEAGHLILGLLTGYEFVSFRVGSIIWTKVDDKVVCKKYSIPGTGGQCLLSPPGDKEKFPFVLYNMGGALMNVITGLFAILLMFLFQWKGFASYGAIIFALIGLCYAIINGVPLKFQIANDGHNVMTMKKDPNARTAFYVQLKVNALLNQGISYIQLPKELITMSKEADLKDSLMVSQKLIEYNYYLERLDFHIAEGIIQELMLVLDTLPEVVKYYVTIEKLFLCYLQGKTEEDINQYNTTQFQGFVKKLKYDINIKRFQYARLMWENACQEEMEKVDEEYKKAKEKFPIKGEVIMNDTLMDYLKGKRENIVKENKTETDVENTTKTVIEDETETVIENTTENEKETEKK